MKGNKKLIFLFILLGIFTITFLNIGKELLLGKIEIIKEPETISRIVYEKLIREENGFQYYRTENNDSEIEIHPTEEIANKNLEEPRNETGVESGTDIETNIETESKTENEVENRTESESDDGSESVIKNKINVEQFGAKGDGITDDTEAIQKAFDQGECYIEFSKGKTYKVTELELREGNKILGNGATLKRANLKSANYKYTDEQIYWNRIILFYYYEGNGGNSKNTLIDNLTFDGSAFEMWNESDGYKYQQASLLLVLAESENNKEIHANINITNCKFINNYSDGIHIAQNVNAKINNCTSQDCFRGGLVVTGGASNVECNNMKCISTKVNDGVDIEIDTDGYNGTKKSNITINNMQIDDDFDVAVVEGSKFIGNNITMTKDTGSFNLENFNSEIEIKNSKFYSDGKSCYFAKANTKLENVQFYAASDIKEDTQLLELIDLGNENTENYFEIKDCKFYGLKDRKYMISGIGGAIINGKIQVIGCYFDPNINEYAIGGKVGMTDFQVREILVKNCTFDNIGYSCCVVKTKYIDSSKWTISNMKVTNNQNKGVFNDWGKEAIIQYID